MKVVFCFRDELRKKERELAEREETILANERIFDAEQSSDASPLTVIPKKRRIVTGEITTARSRPWYCWDQLEVQRDGAHGQRLLDGWAGLTSIQDRQVLAQARAWMSIKQQIMAIGSNLNASETLEQAVNTALVDLNAIINEVQDNLRVNLMTLEGRMPNNQGRGLYSADLTQQEMNRARSSRYGNERRQFTGGAASNNKKSEFQSALEALKTLAGGNSGGGARGGAGGKCFRCGSSSHWVRHCPVSRDDD